MPPHQNAPERRDIQVAEYESVPVRAYAVQPAVRPGQLPATNFAPILNIPDPWLTGE